MRSRASFATFVKCRWHHLQTARLHAESSSTDHMQVFHTFTWHPSRKFFHVHGNAIERRLHVGKIGLVVGSRKFCRITSRAFGMFGPFEGLFESICMTEMTEHYVGVRLTDIHVQSSDRTVLMKGGPASPP